MSYAAIVLAGGGGTRLGGRDKAALRVHGQSLLDRALASIRSAAEVVVVGPPRPVRRSQPVRFTVEDPPGGGPLAGLGAGLAALTAGHPTTVVLAVDMPGVSSLTIRALRRAADTAEGAVLVDESGRRQLAVAVSTAALRRVLPAGTATHRAFWPTLAVLDLVELPARGMEAEDIDTERDLRRWTGSLVAPGELLGDAGRVNLHDWIDELCDVLDLETEVDEGLVLDLAATAARNVEKVAAPITTYLLGYAAGARGAGPESVERLAGAVQDLAERWDRPDAEEVDEAIPDDAGVDHSGDRFED